MTSLRYSARLVTHSSELLGTKLRSVYLISCSHTHLLHTGTPPLVPKDYCITPASSVVQQQTNRVRTSSAGEFSRRQKPETAASCRALQGTEDFQAATDSSSDSDAEGDGPDLSTSVQGPVLPETQKDELLQKIQSSSKKHQRQVYSAPLLCVHQPVTVQGTWASAA